MLPPPQVTARVAVEQASTFGWERYTGTSGRVIGMHTFGPEGVVMKVPLSRIAHTRSGDKGDTCNIGVIAYDERDYPVLVREVTAERVKQHFGELVKGPVERFELPNLGALNFLLHQALGGGGTVSLRTDAQGKTFGAALLGMVIELPGQD